MKRSHSITDREENTMTSFPVQLTSVSDIKAFVDAANRLDCDVDVACGRYLVNGKSIMGLFSIDLSAPVQVQIHGSQAQSDIFRCAIEKFLVG